MRQRLARICAAVVVAAALALALAGFDRWLRMSAQSVPQPPALTGIRLFAVPIAMNATVTAAGMQAPWQTTDAELYSAVEMWKRLHLSDWNRVPSPLREGSLDRMLLKYRSVLNNPQAWDTMTVFDWDATPQPIRTIAYRRMIAYWSGFYGVGAAAGLEPAVVAQTLAAIVMSESWFDHRAQSVNRDGTLDVGLAQASPYARQRLRDLHAKGEVDASLGEDEYLHPWKATRFVALWMALMLEETDGDLDLAVRAYNRGRAEAGDRLGGEYLAMVQSRLSRFIRNQDTPPSWDYVWRRSREIIQNDLPRD